MFVCERRGRGGGAEEARNINTQKHTTAVSADLGNEMFLATGHEMASELAWKIVCITRRFCVFVADAVFLLAHSLPRLPTTPPTTTNTTTKTNHTPVTWRSTLVVRKRLEQTLGRRSTRSSADCAVSPAGRASGVDTRCARVNSNVLFGILPKTWSRSRSTATGASGGACASTSVMRPLPSIVPITFVFCFGFCFLGVFFGGGGECCRRRRGH